MLVVGEVDLLGDGELIGGFFTESFRKGRPSVGVEGCL